MAYTCHTSGVLLKGYGPDAVALAINSLDSSSKKGVQDAMQKAGHLLPAASGTRVASGKPTHKYQKSLFTAIVTFEPCIKGQHDSYERKPEHTTEMSVLLSVQCARRNLNAAGKAESKGMSGTMPKAASRPGTAKGLKSATIRPGAGSAALAATALAANEGVCLQVSNKKDERARKVNYRAPCCTWSVYSFQPRCSLLHERCTLLHSGLWIP